MVLVTYLGSRLGPQDRKLLRHKQMPTQVGEGKIGKRAGTTPPLAAARRRRAGRSRPFSLGSGEQNQINADRFDISN